MWSEENSLTSRWAVSNCHSLSSPSVSAMMTLAVPVEHTHTHTLKVLSHNRAHLCEGRVISLTVSLLIYLHISLQLETKPFIYFSRESLMVQGVIDDV